MHIAAAKHPNPRVIALLLENCGGDEIDERDFLGRTPLMRASATNPSVEIIAANSHSQRENPVCDIAGETPASLLAKNTAAKDCDPRTLQTILDEFVRIIGMTISLEAPP